MKLTNTDPGLLAALDTLLSEQPSGIGEMELINALDKRYPELFPRPDLSDRLLLFQHHFLLRHHLYVLQQQLSDAGTGWLELDLVTITKRPMTSSARQQVGRFDGVRDYYLDLNNLAAETQQSVDEMINGFWKAMAAYQQAPEARQVLGLTGQESREEIRAIVRRLSQQHHPDKGGDPETFRDIQQAWDQLKNQPDN